MIASNSWVQWHNLSLCPAKGKRNCRVEDNDKSIHGWVFLVRKFSQHLVKLFKERGSERIKKHGLTPSLKNSRRKLVTPLSSKAMSYREIETASSNERKPLSSYGHFKLKVSSASTCVINTFNEQPLWKRLFVIASGAIIAIAALLFIIYRKAVFEFIVEYSEKWSQSGWSPFIVGLMIYITSFPPIVGFSFSSTTVGVLFGMSFKGWLIIALSSLAGSVSAFLLFRYFFQARAKALVASNEKLYALSSVLNDKNSFLLLALIRICPFPYSFTNGALAGIPGVTLSHFTLGSLIASPKLVVYLFIGQKIKNIGEDSDTKSKVIDILSIVFTFVVLGLTGWLLIARTSRRLREIENERMVENERYQSPEGRVPLDDDFELDDDLTHPRNTLIV